MTSPPVTIYHNPACGTSRNTLALIRNAGVDPTVIEYLKTPPDRATLESLLQRMNITPRELLREKGTPYAELDLGAAHWTDAQLLDQMLAHPVLINRPIVVTPWGVKLCRPSEVVLDILPLAAARAVREGRRRARDRQRWPPDRRKHMTDAPKKLTFQVEARRVDAHGSLASCKDAELVLDTDLAGRRDALNPAELLLAALAACMLKGIERVTPILGFSLRGVRVVVHGVRQDVPPRMESIRYEILVDTDETERRLELLHDNVRRYGTVFNTVAPGTDLAGVLRRDR